MTVNCLLCKDSVTFLRLVRVEHKTEPMNGYLCFACIRYINLKVAEKYREQGWHITKDCLVNTELDSETKESA